LTRSEHREITPDGKPPTKEEVKLEIPTKKATAARKLV
jgi:hypothetical protein